MFRASLTLIPSAKEFMGEERGPRTGKQILLKRTDDLIEADAWREADALRAQSWGIRFCSSEMQP